eukprot:TRINITY_DN30285_c0_g2_i1.p1 TRINITY_DN30285_c0_g2~~TRINITY_DN30285_c0_g2_i1.p1  ORF type:complete len:654 (-),score=66.20 TRINITY_DN30285_c0_g2_i1:236-2197(-)
MAHGALRCRQDPSHRFIHSRIVALAFALVIHSARTDRGAPKASLIEAHQLPLYTWKYYIVDKRRQRVKWACVNWGGANTEQHVAFGLDQAKLDAIVQRIAELGFNCVRLPYSTEGVLQNPHVSARYWAANADLLSNPVLSNLSNRSVAANRSATKPENHGRMQMLDLFDAVIDALARHKLMVIINNHNSRSCQDCRTYDSEEALWYSPSYSEDDWVTSLTLLARRYKDNPYVVAFDLRHEPHDYGDTKLTWADGNKETDWAMAATKAGDAVLQENPSALIVVEALCGARDLRPAGSHAIILTVGDRLVYAVHAYRISQLFSMWSELVVPWDTTRSVALKVIVLFGAAILTVFCVCGVKRPRQHLRRLQSGQPNRGFWCMTMGAWIAVISFICLVVCNILYVSSVQSACMVAAKYEHEPNILKCVFSLVVGAGLFVLGLRSYYFQGSATEAYQTKVPLLPEHVQASNSESPVGVASDQDAKQIREVWTARQCCSVQVGLGSVFVLILLLISYVWSLFVVSHSFFEYHHDTMWGFAASMQYPVPVWVGGIGASDARGSYWLNLVQYLSEHDFDWGYAVLNKEQPTSEFYQVGTGWVRPESSKSISETWGVLDDDWSSIRQTWKLMDLRGIQTTPASWIPRTPPCDPAAFGVECYG